MHERAGAAHGKIDAPFAFEVMDHRVDGGGLKRISTDEQRMKAEDLLQQRILHIARDELEDRFLRAEPDEVRCDPDHVGEGGKRLVGEVDESAVENGV